MAAEVKCRISKYLDWYTLLYSTFAIDGTGALEARLEALPGPKVRNLLAYSEDYLREWVRDFFAGEAEVRAERLLWDRCVECAGHISRQAVDHAADLIRTEFHAHEILQILRRDREFWVKVVAAARALPVS